MLWHPELHTMMHCTKLCVSFTILSPLLCLPIAKVGLGIVLPLSPVLVARCVLHTRLPSSSLEPRCTEPVAFQDFLWNALLSLTPCPTRLLHTGTTVSDESLKRKGVEANKLQAHLKKLPTGMVRVTSQSISLFQGEDESTVEVLYTEVTPVMLWWIWIYLGVGCLESPWNYPDTCTYTMVITAWHWTGNPQWLTLCVCVSGSVWCVRDCGVCVCVSAQLGRQFWAAKRHFHSPFPKPEWVLQEQKYAEISLLVYFTQETCEFLWWHCYMLVFSLFACRAQGFGYEKGDWNYLQALSTRRAKK